MDSPIARAEHNEFVKRVEDEDHRQNRRLEKLEKHVETSIQIATSVERLAISMENMLKEQERQGRRLEALESRPADHWNTFIKALLSGVGTTIAGAILGALAMFYLH